MKKCCVIGSINMDMVARVDRFPKPGESRIGSSFQTVPGGKGANQAIALGRLGIPTTMVGQIGQDMYGELYLENFRNNQVNTDLITAWPNCSTGIAVIEVDDNGENHIVVVPGANMQCDVAWLDDVLPKVMDCEIFLLQLEIPLDVIYEAISRLRSAGKMIILDPAPATPIPTEVLAMVDIVTPNATELHMITPELPETCDVNERMEFLLKCGVKTVVHKSGSKGAYITTDCGIQHMTSFSVKAVDSTAAGDTFNAGLAAGLAMDFTIMKATELANAAAALSVTKLGAQGGMPTLAQALEFIEANK